MWKLKSKRDTFYILASMVKNPTFCTEIDSGIGCSDGLSVVVLNPACPLPLFACLENFSMEETLSSSKTWLCVGHW